MVKLMRVTVLGLLQGAVLQAWADHNNRMLVSGKTIDSLSVSPDAFKPEIQRLVANIPPDFFTELRFSGFDASVDVRVDLVRQMLFLLELRKTFADIRSTHRSWRP